MPTESPVGYTQGLGPLCNPTDGNGRLARLASACGRGLPVGVGVGVSPVVVRVLVLYSHPLMGEGLGRMLAAEPGLAVEAVDVAMAGAVDAALATEPDVIVLEEGGALDAADIVRRSTCAVVLDVDITTTNAWSLRREVLPTRPDDFLATLRSAVARATERGGAHDADLGVHTATLSG